MKTTPYYIGYRPDWGALSLRLIADSSSIRSTPKGAWRLGKANELEGIRRGVARG